jgi:hypothetical protein
VVCGIQHSAIFTLAESCPRRADSPDKLELLAERPVSDPPAARSDWVLLAHAPTRALIGPAPAGRDAQPFGRHCTCDLRFHETICQKTTLGV